MSSHKCKSFIRPSPYAYLYHLPSIQSTTFAYSQNYAVFPHNCRLYSPPGHLGFANMWRPPFAYGALLSQPRRLGVSEFVGFNLNIARHLCDHSNPQKHENDRELSGQNRSRDININRNENHTFWFIPRWLRWLFGSVITLWGGHKADLLRIEGDVEKVVEMVEDIAETMEKVATMTEEISKDIAEEFPEEGAINKVAHFVEHLSEELIEDAHNTQEFIHKMTSTEKIVETSIEKIVETSIETAVEAFEDLIKAKPAISKSESDRDDRVIEPHAENAKSNSKL